jgi:hypothetical protein
MPHHRDDFQHWYERAREARELADRLEDSAAREDMLVVADTYEQMAAQAEMRVRASLSCSKHT